MKPLHLPENFSIPTLIVKEQYVLEPLAPVHNEMDYDAWMSSRAELKGIFGPTNAWPGEVVSLEQNLSDLKRHYQEFIDREAFAYTILSPDRKQCIGCLYIRPTPIADYDCRVDFWFRTSAKHLEPVFFNDLELWLSYEWKFEQIAYPGRSLPWEEYNQRAGTDELR